MQKKILKKFNFPEIDCNNLHLLRLAIQAPP